MKIKLSKSQWKLIGKTAGWVPTNSTDQSQIDLNEIRQIIDEGQRAFRLGKSINRCPEFENNTHKAAWKEGFRSAMHKRTLEEAYSKFIIEHFPSDDFKQFMDSLEDDNTAKMKPTIRLKTTESGSLVPVSDFDRRKLLQITGKDEFNSTPDGIRFLEKRLWNGVARQFGIKTPQTSKYFMLIDGIGPERYIAQKQKKA